MSSKGRTWGRLAAEFGVIFVSVILALIADDWRETRNEREEGIESLQLILEDLQEEQAGLAFFRDHLMDQVTGAAELLRLLEESGPPDAIARAYSDVVLYFNYESSYPAYRGLAESGGLRLVEDGEVREAIIDYHDGAALYLEGLRLTMEEDAEELGRMGRRHFTRRPSRDEDGEFSPDRPWTFRLESAPEAVLEDREFIGALGTAGASARYLVARIDGRFLERNLQTIDVVEGYLSEVGR